MLPTTITTTAAALLAATVSATTTTTTSTSLHYKFRARVTGPTHPNTPQVNGWALELERMSTSTHGVPGDWLWGALYNPDYTGASTTPRGGDTFYTLNAPGHKRQRTDVKYSRFIDTTTFGFTRFSGNVMALPSVEIVGLQDLEGGEGQTQVVQRNGVPRLEAVGFANATFVACNSSFYEAFAPLSWTDLSRWGTWPIYNTDPDWRNCTEIQLVPECASEGPEYEGLEETPCVEDITTVL